MYTFIRRRNESISSGVKLFSKKWRILLSQIKNARFKTHPNNQEYLSRIFFKNSEHYEVVSLLETRCKKGRLPNETKEAILDLYLERGKTVYEISNVFGVSKSTIYHIIREAKNGLKTKKMLLEERVSKSRMNDEVLKSIKNFIKSTETCFDTNHVRDHL